MYKAGHGREIDVLKAVCTIFVKTVPRGVVETHETPSIKSNEIKTWVWRRDVGSVSVIMSIILETSKY